jgi:peroxiredoxin
MSAVTVGAKAPSFRLPSAQGNELGPEDYRGRSNVILFFAKGMACGFCRQKMSQLSRGLPRFRALDTEILQVSPTTLERGRFYAKNFPLPFPYLCDPEYRVYGAYGMTPRAHSLVWKAKVLVQAIRMPQAENDFGPPKPSPRELGRLLNDDDLGLFVIDKQGVIRYANAGPYTTYEGSRIVGGRQIPSNEELIAELGRSQGGAAARPT